MNLELERDGGLRLDAGMCSLNDLRPIVNGKIPVGSWRVHDARPDKGTFAFALTTGGIFYLAWAREESRLCLQYRMGNFPAEIALQSFGLRANRLAGVRAVLRNGYFSWDGSYYLRPEDEAAQKPVRGYAMTQLLATDSPQGVVLGFDRHDRFQHGFTFENRAAQLTIETFWDEKDAKGNGARPVGEVRSGATRCEGERLVIFAPAAAEEGLRAWARLVAECASIPPRITTPRIRGWCSWYNLYASITEANVLEHLRSVRKAVTREHLSMSIFQIDDGFTPEMGDWLDVKPQFPRGMKPLLDDIRAAGFKPGLWIAPFMVGNRSRLYQEHPDWIVRDRQTGGPLIQMRFYGEFRWHKRSEEYYILDTTHPGAFAWLREVFRIWRKEWGCEYFKTDFMHFGSEHGPERAVWHRPGLTRIEVWRRAAEMIRASIGDALWLGCGCPLWASVGLVDGVRIARDIGVEWDGNTCAQSLLRDQAARNFAHGILWQADPDCILLRERFHHLTDTEVRSLALYAAMTGGIAMTSDALDGLSADRMRLWKLALSFGPNPCNFPLLGDAAHDPVTVQVRHDNDTTAVFILNPTDAQQGRSYPLERLGLKPPLHAWDWTHSRALPHLLETLTVTLDPHEGALFLLTANPARG